LVKIRLQRHGRKKKPYYHIVAADVRAKRDGKIIEDLGRYDPVGSVTKVTLKTDRVIHWLKTGAQPTDTVRAILKKEGVMYRIHLMGWGKSEEEINATLDAWKTSKGTKVAKTGAELMRERLKAEEESYKVTQAEKAKKAEAAAKKAAEAPAEEVVEAAAEETAAVETAEATEAASEVAVSEEAPAEVAAEAPAAEEAPAEEAPVAEEAPAEEPAAEEATDEENKEA
jgi:small subunit ribosomal protein S16